MDSRLDAENGIAQRPPVANGDVHVMIIEQLGTQKALAKMADLEDEIKVKTDRTTRKILADAQEKAEARGQPYTETAWQGLCARVSESVARKSAEKASGDVLVNAFIDFLVSAVGRESLEVTDLNVLSRCDMLIPHLEKVNAAAISDDCNANASFAKIRQLNRNAVWTLDHTDEDNLQWMCDSKALDGLMGTMAIDLRHSQNFPLLSSICERCHPECFALKLHLRNRSNEPLQDLAHHKPILRRITYLLCASPSPINFPTVWPDDNGNPEPQDSETRSYFKALDAICHDFTFDLELNVGINPQPLRTCTHIPKNLVGLTVDYPTKHDISWLVEYETKGMYRLQLHYANDINDFGDLARSRCAELRLLRLTKPLKDAADVALFNQLRRAHPNAEFKFELKTKDLSQFLLLDLPKDMFLFIASHNRTFVAFRASVSEKMKGSEVVCDSSVLPLVAGMGSSISPARTLKFIFRGDGHDFDGTPVTAALQNFPNVEELAIVISPRWKYDSNLPHLLRQAVIENLKKLKTLNTPIDHGLSFADLDIPGFNTYEWSGRLVWERRA